jgi:diacylglycerol kinase (ATP)
VNAARLIINPISGAGADAHAAEKRADLARRVAAARGVPLDIAITEREGHARELARRVRDAGTPLVIAWGGDGTVNEIVRELAGTAIPLGIVPSGSGNGLATELRFSRDPVQALEDAFGGSDRPIDVGELNGRPFVNIGGIGFDGHIAHRFHALKQGKRGALPYLTIGLRSVWRYRAASYRITLDAETIDRRALLVAFANGCQYGNNAVIAPRSRPDDGKLEVVIVDRWPAAKNFLRLHHLFRRSADRAPGVITRQTTEARVLSDQPMEIHVDGEPVEATREARVSIRPGGLVLRVPPSTPADTARGSAR